MSPDSKIQAYKCIATVSPQSWWDPKGQLRSKLRLNMDLALAWGRKESGFVVASAAKAQSRAVGNGVLSAGLLQGLWAQLISS